MYFFFRFFILINFFITIIGRLNINERSFYSSHASNAKKKKKTGNNAHTVGKIGSSKCVGYLVHTLETTINRFDVNTNSSGSR